MKLISWNVAGRTAILPAQAAAVARQEPDLVALQEVRASTLPRWTRALAAIGLDQLLDSGEFRSKRLFNLTASRWPLIPTAAVAGPQPERILSLIVETPHGPLDLHNAHIRRRPPTG